MIPVRLFLGPGPSPATNRVMRAMANPVLERPASGPSLAPISMLKVCGRVGLKGAGSTLANVLLVLSAPGRVPVDAGHRSASAGAAVAAAHAAVAR